MDAAAALFVQPEQMSRVGSSVAITRSADKGQKSQQQQQQKQQALVAHTKANANGNSNDINAIIAQLTNEFINYRFTVYRCACKFVKLQKILHTSKIPYQLVSAILQRHGMDACLEQDKLMVPPFQFTALLHDIYYACEKLGHFNESQGYQLEKATALLANFFWNIFDPHRRHSISLLEIKLTLLLLCNLFNNDTLVAEFFNLVVNVKTKCVTKFSFEYMVKILSKVLTYIGEGKSYGHHNLQKVMEQCFARCQNSSGITEYQFHCLWNSAQTRLLIYTNLLALIKRIEETEHLIHKNSCAGCHMESIIGIRFKCQNCSDLSLCLSCFACGYSSNKHLPTHRLLEIFTEDQPPKKWTRYFARLCCFHKYGLKSQQQHEEMKSFCNAQCTDVSGGDIGCNATTETRIVAISNVGAASRQSISTRNTYTVADSSSVKSSATEATQNRRESAENHHDLSSSLAGLTSTATNASERLQSIIDRLLLQNVKLEMQLSKVATASHEEISTFLSTHHMFLVQIINEMRNLSNSSTTSTILTASTPHLSKHRHMSQHHPLDILYDPTGAGDHLTHSINGADLNRSYLEANKSDFSFKDLSLWFDPKKSKSTSATIQARASFPCSSQMLRRPVPENTLSATNGDFDGRDTDMMNFKLLLHKVKEIVEDSYSDNAELSAATQNLEYMLDSMIKDEEIRRRSA